ncbi:MAG: NAD(P)H-dependent oxidoreductase [Gilvibacter sp.]
MAIDIISSLNWRYATKRFDSAKKLSPEQLSTLKEAFNLTATSYGLQPLKMLVIQDQTIKEQLVPLSMDQPQVRDASHVLVFCVQSELTKAHINDYFSNVQRLRDTPKEVLAPFKDHIIDTFSDKEATEVANWMTKQAYLAMGNLLTVCALEGIDSCPMEGFQPDAYDALLGLQELGLKSVLVMPVGFRAQDDMFASMKKVRRGVQEVVIDY